MITVGFPADVGPAWDPASATSPATDKDITDVAVIGLGYVGLILAVVLARAGLHVTGVDSDPAVVAAIGSGRAPFFEPGLDDELRSLPAGQLTVRTRAPAVLPPTVVICVGTPVDPGSRQPDLASFDLAVDEVADSLGPDTLVIVRSTVPVGTCRQRVLPKLARRRAAPLLAACPERTIQGQAMAEVRQLPQVIGGLDARSAELAGRLLGHVASRLTMVSSLEAAELVKLINNVHTDLIYGFGNEVALLASALGLDAEELIHAANVGYPRPDLSRPGFVGGSCLTKDPYLLMRSARDAGISVRLTAAAREVNESVPRHVAEQVLAALRETGRPTSTTKVLVCGMAYKGRPETGDVRGSAAAELARLLTGQVAVLAGHDFRVSGDRIRKLGYQPESLEDGLRQADAAVILIEHPGYARIDATMIASLMRPSAVVFDMWGVLQPALKDTDKVRYLRWGRG